MRYLCLIICLGFMPYICSANIVITEIGAYLPEGKEFIEIYNTSSNSISIEGWKFLEGGTKHGLSAEDYVISGESYALICDKADVCKTEYPGIQVIDSSWGSLKESGEEIGLINNEGEVQEQFVYLNCSDTSLERIDYFISDYTETNWKHHMSGHSAGYVTSEEGYISQDIFDDLDTDTSSVFNVFGQAYAPGIILINEIMPNPQEGEEWIELYNTGNSSITLMNWKIQEGGGSVTHLSNMIGYQGDARFLVIPKSQLNNKGDTIMLLDPQENIIDQVTYGDFDDGKISDNAEIPKKGESLSRKKEGQDSNIDSFDFVITDILTPGSVNSVLKTIVTNNSVQEVEIITPVRARITYYGTPRVGQLVFFVGSGSLGEDLRYYWEFGNGVTSKQVDPVFIYDEEGKYSVRLTVTDEDNIKDTLFLDVPIAGEVLDIPMMEEEDREDDTSAEEIEFPKQKDIDVVYAINDVRQYTKGTLIETTGIVTALPNMFGKQYFYVNGLMVYMYSGNFPTLSLGDKVWMEGKLSSTHNEVKVNLKNAEDIMIVSQNNIIEPIDIDITDITEDYEGQLVRIQGELMSKKGSTLIMDDGSNEVVVYIKRNTGISTKGVEVGDSLRITGIISQYDDKYRMLPRFFEDIIHNYPEKEDGEVLGETFVASDVNNSWKYIGSALFAGLFLGGFIWMKKKRA